jgi:hypothetical protein
VALDLVLTLEDPVPLAQLKVVLSPHL